MCVRACVRACVLSENLLDFTTCDTRGIHKIIRTEEALLYYVKSSLKGIRMGLVGLALWTCSV